MAYTEEIHISWIQNAVSTSSFIRNRDLAFLSSPANVFLQFPFGTETCYHRRICSPILWLEVNVHTSSHPFYISYFFLDVSRCLMNLSRDISK